MEPSEVFGTVRETLTAAFIGIMEEDEGPMDALSITPVERSLGFIAASFIVMTAIDADVEPQDALEEFLSTYDYESALRTLKALEEE